MTKYFLSLSIFMMVVLSSCGESKTVEKNNITITETMNDSTKCCNATAEEIAALRKPMDLYVEAAIKGDSKIAEAAFTENATISHVEDGKMISLPIKALYEYYDQTGPHPASYDITFCNVSGDVAIVAIDSKFGDARFDDMFSMIKDGDDWKIVSKIFRVK